jgi:hypothetical protein
MERFRGTVERARDESCTAWMIADIVQSYDTKWIHHLFGMRLEAVGAAGIDWRARNATIDVQIERNIEWTT